MTKVLILANLLKMTKVAIFKKLIKQIKPKNLLLNLAKPLILGIVQTTVLTSRMVAMLQSPMMNDPTISQIENVK